MVKSATSRKRQRTREALVQAALEVIREKGFEGASLDEIAARAGVTKGAIYSNYRSKAELIWEAAAQSRLSLRPVYKAGVPLRAQGAVAEALIAQFPRAEEQAAFNEELQLYIRRDAELRAKQAALYKQIFDTSEEELADRFGHELAVSPRVLTLAAQAMALGFLAQRQRTPEEITPDLVRTAFECLGIGATTPRSDSVASNSSDQPDAAKRNV